MAERRRRLRAWLFWIGIGLVLAWGADGTEISPRQLVSGLGDAARYVVGTSDRPGSGFFPPDFTRWRDFLWQMTLTVKMALWGTALAVVTAMPLAMLAAANTAPHRAIYQLTRRLLDCMRGLNEFVLALIFVAAVGLGPFPGVMALAVHTTGILAKLIAEGIEAVDPDQVAAVEATGATRLQVFTHGIWPQVIPHVVSMTLYRFESNVRAATVLGMVGAGGIGFFLTESIRSFNNRAACAILLIILLAVFVVDALGAQVRRRLT